ncbi:MAG TPA: response regulator [Candidatus Angelobacter sp.]
MPKVLLIEDSKLVKILHERVLTRAGYQVVSAADGEEALKIAAGVAPDVILLDMMLPKVSGPEVLRSLKKDPATAHIPVIVLTALSRKNEEKLLHDGADAFLEKAALLDSTEPLLDLVKRTLQEKKVPQPQPFRADAMNWTLNGTESGIETRI